MCVLNMTPVSYEQFTIGVAQQGSYSEILNSEKDIYDGCNMCNFRPVKSGKSEDPKWSSQITIRLAPFAAVWLVHEKKNRIEGHDVSKQAGVQERVQPEAD